MRATDGARASSAALCCSGIATAQEADRQSDRREIGAVLERIEQAWNTHDMHALANLFHEDGVWVLWTGLVWTGRKAIEDGHAEVHKTARLHVLRRADAFEHSLRHLSRLRSRLFDRAAERERNAHASMSAHFRLAEQA
jgi:hypothetical protein